MSVPAPGSAPGIVPDGKDWTWVLREPCPDCGFVAADLDRAEIGSLLRDDAVGWRAVLSRAEARRRPDAQTWSPLEYACHVRDVHRVFGERVDLMLGQDEPTFANWDQDATAVEDRYDLQDPHEVAEELAAAADAVAARYDALRDEPETTWSRRGLRSNGSDFTVDSIARYHLHDVLHHSHDVRAVAALATVAAYDGAAAAYRDATSELDDSTRAELDWFAAAAGPGGRVLEVGSGGGRDAVALEARGLLVRRTDVTPAFVDLLRAQGHAADLLDPRTCGLDDLGDAEHGPYDGVWASASLLHVARADLAHVLARLAAVTRPGGALGVSLKEGDGERWSVHGSVRAPRRFTYWRADPLRAVLAASGWRVAEVGRTDGLSAQTWLTVRASRCAG